MKPLQNWTIVLTLVSAGVAAQEPRELSWNDLLPTSQAAAAAVPGSKPETQLDGFLEDVETNQNMSVEVVAELNGTNVKIPGFIVPLEFEGGTVSSLLLVPFFGACMHYPPPPANQVVHVTLAKPMVIDSLWEPFWASGQMTTQFRNSEMGAAGYSITSADLTVYD
ncbi:MAG: DUF3299 domain-containing protein [Lysobacterales bacterium]